ncbi:MULTISPECIES: hypothetical protein [Cryobacterium]|uniref:Uncharacterized protein n=1 Tax=Cryobacterium glucosi TaxID=1259175 RepID=A0ABY2IM54_9MICO|nr:MULTISPECIES: hypothetical protein [Cryobacterium]TFB91614.1 hypothetical protein E3O39_18770 [Cryobacterium sp. MDB2-A-1]TFC07551.1 hypothetical protein E3O59_09700 [Cryobacterium sp. MDB2-33-2]TFC13078.1 hypothetical protein E3O35_06290 [Cryobacterium sp. MDB2-A-2]TFC18669.1 hypothetical protein E3O46_13340 [Cryobacterium glucosi]TFC22986.1 hypothetical protein E3O51_01310 [Cryobacterium sp. MDB2-10]
MPNRELLDAIIRYIEARSSENVFKTSTTEVSADEYAHQAMAELTALIDKRVTVALAERDKHIVSLLRS